MSILPKIFVAILFFSLSNTVKSQDSFFRNFSGSRSYFNPALVGLSGSFSVNGKYRTSWNTPNTSFRSIFLSIEESVPCFPFDLGVSLLQDNEGSANFQTTDFGASFATKFALTTGNYIHNFRAGLSGNWIRKSIDLSRLTFSDQLDPKYGFFDQNGNRNPTSFISPNNGRSSMIFNPSFGVALWSLWGDGDRAASSLIGYSQFHQIPFLGNSNAVESVLNPGSGPNIPSRSIYFVELELILNSAYRSFMAVSPLLLYGRQSDIDYVEVGSSVRFLRDFSLGFYFHKSFGAIDRPDSDFYSLQANIGVFLNEDQKTDVAFSWSNTTTGVKNLLGPSFELSFTYHLTRSFVCELSGRGNKVDYSSGPKCARFSEEHKYRYDNYTLHKSKRKR